MKTCFVISPLGEDQSPTRLAAEDLFDLLLEPALTSFNFELVRADRIPGSGAITSEIIEFLQNAELCVIDLTGSNANVFYEAGRRHETGLPFVQVIKKGEKIPFDLAGIRTIQYDLSGARSTRESVQELTRYVAEFEKAGYTRRDTGISISTLAQAIDRIERKVDRIGPLSAIGPTGSLPVTEKAGEPAFINLLADPRKALAEAIFAGRADVAVSSLLRLEQQIGLSEELLGPAGMIAAAGFEQGANIVLRLLEDRATELNDEHYDAGVASYASFLIRTNRAADGAATMRQLIDKTKAELNPGPSREAFFLNQLQRVEYAAQNYAAAAEIAKEVVAKDPTNGSHWYNLSLNLEKVEDMDGACDAIEKCLARDEEQSDEDVDHINQAVDVYSAAGRFSQAKEAYERLRKLDPTRAAMALASPTNRAAVGV